MGGKPTGVVLLVAWVFAAFMACPSVVEKSAYWSGSTHKEAGPEGQKDAPASRSPKGPGEDVSEAMPGALTGWAMRRKEPVRLADPPAKTAGNEADVFTQATGNARRPERHAITRTRSAADQVPEPAKVAAARRGQDRRAWCAARQNLFRARETSPKVV